MDGIASVAFQVLERIAAPFLSSGSVFSVSSLGCALLVAVAVIAWRLRARRRPVRFKVILRALFPRRVASASTGIDFSYLVFNIFIFGMLLGWALLSMGAVSTGLNSLLVTSFGTRAPAEWPELATRAGVTLVLFLAYELGYWLHHYLSHRIPFLWEFHKVHHTANVLTPMTVFRLHPVDSWVFVNMVAVFVGSAHGAMSYALGVSVEQYTITDTNIILVLFIHAYLHFQHSHLWIAFRGLPGRLLLSPAHHQVHHSNNPVHFEKNLGSCLAVWDWLFGTLYVPSKTPERLQFGVDPEGRDTQTITEAYLVPFRRAATHVTSRIAADAPAASSDAADDCDARERELKPV